MVKTFAAFDIAATDDAAVCPTTDKGEAAVLMGQLPEDVRQEAMDLLVSSAVADGKVVPSERDWLLAVGGAAGMSDDAVDELIADALLEADPAF